MDLNEKIVVGAINAAIKAGHAALEIYNQSDEFWQIEYKEDHSPLTRADMLSHSIIARELSEFAYPLLSEEGSQIDYETRKQWKTFWLIDPIDGTKEFIKRNGEFTVNIALIEESIPVFGVIYVPVSGALYYGIVGRGAWYWKKGELIDSLASCLNYSLSLPFQDYGDSYRVLCSRSFRNRETENYLEELKETHPKIEFISRGSSLKLCMIASGEADLYPRFGPTMEWDTAAGHAILKSVGKDIVDANHLSSLVYNKRSLKNPSFIAGAEVKEGTPE